MKKLISGLAAVLLILSLVGCPSPETPGKDPETLTQILNAGGNINLEGKIFSEDAIINKTGITVENADLGGKTLTVNAAGVTLKNIKNANLVIGESVGNGDVFVESCNFSNVTVNGGGANSIHFKTTTVTYVNVKKESVRVVLEEGTIVENATISADNAKLEAKTTEGNTDASTVPSVGTLEVSGDTKGVQIQKVTATTIVLKKNVKNVTVEDVAVEKIEVKENANTTTIKGGTVKTIEVEKEVEKIKIEDCKIKTAEISNEAGNIEVAGGTVETLHVVTKTTTEIKTVITISKEETVIENAAVVVKDGKITTEIKKPLEVVVSDEIAEKVDLPETVEQVTIVDKKLFVAETKILEFKAGTEFDKSGIYLILKYSNGNENTIELDPSAIEVIGFDSSVAVKDMPVTLKTAYEGGDISTNIHVTICEIIDYVSQAVRLIFSHDYDGAVEKLRTNYKENPNSDEAKIFYALSEIASISTDKSIADLLQNHFSIEEYPATMNALINGSWLKEYYERSRIDTYIPKEAEYGYYYRCDIDESEEKYEYEIAYIQDEDGDWINAETHEYKYYDDGRETIIRRLSVSGVAKPSETGKYFIRVGDVQFANLVGESNSVDQEIPKGTPRYNLLYDNDKYVIDYDEIMTFVPIRMSEEFKNSNAYKNSLIKGIENAETASLALAAGFLECNPKGVNELVDDCIDVFDNDRIADARKVVESMEGTVSIPAILMEAFELEDILGPDPVAFGKTEFNILLSALDIIKGTLQYISSYDLSFNLYELKEALYKDYEDLPDSTYVNLINSNTLAPRSDAAERMGNAKDTYINSLGTILDAYEEMFGEEGYYPEGLKQYVNAFAGSIIPGVEALKKSIEEETVFYLPGLDIYNGKSVPSWDKEVNTEKDIGIDMGKLFTPGYFSDILAKDNDGNGALYIGVEYELSYFSSKKPEKLTPEPSFDETETDEWGTYYDYSYEVKEKLVLPAEFDIKAKKEEIKALFKESGYERCELDVSKGYKINLEKIYALFENVPKEFMVSTEEVLSFDYQYFYMYSDDLDWVE